MRIRNESRNELKCIPLTLDTQWQKQNLTLNTTDAQVKFIYVTLQGFFLPPEGSQSAANVPKTVQLVIPCHERKETFTVHDSRLYNTLQVAVISFLTCKLQLFKGIKSNLQLCMLHTLVGA